MNGFRVLWSLIQDSPIIVKIVTPPADPTGGLAKVLLAALSLTGVLILIAVALGLLMAGILLLARSRRPLQ
jgi:hypothetical protein